MLGGDDKSQAALAMDVRTALKIGITQLRDAGTTAYTLSAELLLLHALGRERAWLYAHPEEIISEQDSAKYFSLLARRATGEPVQHLIGSQEFWGMNFAVSRDVLIPRPETEHVVEVALDRLALREIRKARPQVTQGEGIHIADVGTGSGCIAIALAKELPIAKIVATDISGAALKIAKINAAANGFAERIVFAEGNLLEPANPFAAAADRYELIVSNPPYVARKAAATLARDVRDFEPDLALFGGEEGYELYADLVRQSWRHLVPGGILVMELGHDSLPAVQPLLDSAHWTRVGVTNDLAGIPRVIAAEKLDEENIRLE